MPLPTVKQRIWQALRLKPSTLNELALVVDAPLPTIYVYIRRWHTAKLLAADKIHDRKPGPAQLRYAMIDRSVISPPPTTRLTAKLEKSQQIWAALAQKPSTIKELVTDDRRRSNIYKTLQGWLADGLITATPSPEHGKRKPPMLYSIVDSIH
jgi:hypothetical protein